MTAGLALLHVLGFAGSSHLLHFLATLFPGYPASDLARVSSYFVDADPQGFFEPLIFFALMPALLEEILFRGVLFAIFERLRGARFAILASALVFGLAHLDAHHGTVAALLGLQLGVLRHLYGLPLPIACHLVNNMLALGATFLGRAGDPSVAPFEANAASLALALVLAGSSWAALVHLLRSTASPRSAARSGLQTHLERDE